MIIRYRRLNSLVRDSVSSTNNLCYHNNVEASVLTFFRTSHVLCVEPRNSALFHLAPYDLFGHWIKESHKRHILHNLALFVLRRWPRYGLASRTDPN